MFSHIRRMRHMAMVVIAVAGLAWAVPGHTASVKRNFRVTLSGNGVLKGSFTGPDIDNNGKIDDTNSDGKITAEALELTAILASWTPGSSLDPAAFSLPSPTDFTDTNVVLFQYDIDSNTIEQFFLGDANNFNNFVSYVTDDPLCSDISAARCIVIGGPSQSAGEPAQVKDADPAFKVSAAEDPSAVPEPGTIILFGLGLMGMSGYALARRRRGVNPR